MADLKRVQTREFLRNINAMTEPCEVYTRSELKGTWYPGQTTHSDAKTMDTLRAFVTATNMIITSSPARGSRRTARARPVLDPEAAGSFGVARPAPKPISKRKRPN